MAQIKRNIWVLFVENQYPLAFRSLQEVKNYITFVRDTNEAAKNTKALFTICNDQDIKQSFSNCKFKAI